MIGTTLGHYRILESLGSGGMGVVYRAHDERLRRDVAVKVLPPEAGLDDPARARLRREALTLSRLNHPGIGAVYDLDTEGGVDYLVMELVPGQTLDERLREGPLPEGEVVAIGIQAAEGLAAAHREGVVHRDVKPANLRLTPAGRLKILDFGVAFLSDPLRERAETVTQSAADQVAGTLAYMAPEQLLGESVDPRTDVYGLGATLYELATGERPFRAPLPAPMIDAVLNRAPEHPCVLRPGLSPRFAEILLRCLEKRPERRYRTAEELLEDLRGIGAGGGAASRASFPGRRPLQSVAVLPLENLSRDSEQEYFADGMTEALIAGLARVRGLRVISRTSVMRYKQERPPLPAIARALHVDAVVEGSVLRSGNRVRITANLIDAGADRHLWTDTYDRDLGDFLALQSDVASAIAQEIQCRLTPPEETRGPRRVVDPESVQAYLKGRFQWEKRSEEGIGRAIEFFNQAIERDPLYALAYVGLADSYLVLANFSLVASRGAAVRARAAASRALELDPSLGEAHTSLAAIADMHDWNRPEAERLYRRAIELSPNYATAHHWYSDYLTSMGRFDEALAEVRRAQDLDPLSMTISTSVATVLNYARKHQEAAEHFLGVVELDPRFPLTWLGLGGAYEMLGRHEEAIAAFQKARDLTNGSTYTVMALAHAYALAGQREQAVELVEGLQREAPRRYVSPYSLAAVYTALGETDKAFQLLDIALEARDRALVWLPVSPRLDPLRGDPRFAKYLKAVGAR
ncbi:MAG TPA: protein kinase [Candidatus Eisenbacteria bacterium]